MQKNRLNKIILAALVASSLTAPALAVRSLKGEDIEPVAVATTMPAENNLSLKSGPYVGLGVGYENYQLKNYQNFIDSGNTYEVTPTLSARGALASLFAGYGQFYNRAYLGAEVHGDVASASTRDSFNAPLSTHSMTSHIQSSLGFDLVPGIKLSETTLLYGKIGLIRTHIKTKEDSERISSVFANIKNPHKQERLVAATPPYQESKSQWITGTNYGVGLESLIASHVSVRAEYDYINYRHFNTAVSRFIPSDNRFTLGVVYRVS